MSKEEAAVFENSSPEVLQIVVDKPENWSCLLTMTLCRLCFAETDRALDDIKRGVFYRQPEYVEQTEIAEWFGMRANELRRLLKMVSTVVNDDLPKSLNAHQSPEQAIDIHRACGLLCESRHHLVRWEQIVHCTEGPDGFDRVRDGMSGWTSWISDPLWSIPRRLEDAMIDPPDDDQVTIELKILPPKNLEKIGRIAMRLATGRRGWLW